MMRRLGYFFAIMLLTISVAYAMSSETYSIEGLDTDSGSVDASSEEYLADFILGILSGETASAIFMADIGFFHSAIIPVCFPNWFEGEWGACNGTHQIKTFTDGRECDAENISYDILQTCCIAVWQYGDWTTCTDSSQTRDATNTTSCDDTSNQLPLIQGCTVDDGGSSGGGGGGGGSTTTPTEIENETMGDISDYNLISMSPNETTHIIINETDFGLTNVSVDVNEEVKGNFIIEETKNLSETRIDLGINKDFEVYEVFDVDKIEITNKQIDIAILDYRVEKGWLEEQSNGSSVLAKKLFNTYSRENYLDNWRKINTTFLYIDDTYYYYKIETNGFSTFVTGFDRSEICTGFELTCRNDNLQICGSDSIWETVETCDYGCSDTECISLVDKVVGSMATILSVLVIVLIILLIIYWKFYGPGKVEKSKKVEEPKKIKKPKKLNRLEKAEKRKQAKELKKLEKLEKAKEIKRLKRLKKVRRLRKIKKIKKSVKKSKK